MAKISTEKVKEYLKDSELFPETMVKRENQMIVVFDWKVLNYRELNMKILYYKTVASAEFTWTLQLEKTNGLLFVALLVTNAVNKHVYFVVGDVDGSCRTAINKCEEISDGLYVTQFCNRIISDPRNKYIIDDALMIQCRYENIPLKMTMKCDKHVQLRFLSDVCELTKDLKNLYGCQNNTDYTLKLRDKYFGVHKWVLRTRSKYFYRMFDRDDGLFKKIKDVFDESHDIMEQVLMFIYSGELTTDLDLGSLIEVFILARFLEIPSLMIRCISVMTRCLNEKNVLDVLYFAKKRSISQLENAVKHFLLCLPDDWQKTKIWKDIIAQVEDIEKNEA